MTDTKPNTPGTSAERIAQICDAFAVDLQHSCDVDNATDALKALVDERDQLRDAYSYIGKDGKSVLAKSLEDERDVLRDELAGAVNDCKILMVNLECLSEATGESLDPEDAAIVGQIRLSLKTGDSEDG